MFQAFILYCMTGLEPSGDTCIVDVAQFFQTEELECNLEVIARVNEIEEKLVKQWYIYDAGCNQYLPEVKSEKSEL